jgi:nicotinamide phosphoribosyltransferase
MKEISKSPILNTDSYKVSMFSQYPPGTTGVYSYIESRGGHYDKTLFFGLQAFIKEYLLKPITQADIDEAAEVLAAHGEPFNREGWQYILDQHKGYLPVVIKAVPEGSVVPVKNVLATIENTDPKCFWLTTWLETALLRAIWYPTTVATQSWSIRQLILNFLEKTGDTTLIDFKLHDFGARGVSSFESAGIGGAAHLVNFMGTDTLSGVLYARKYYGAGVAGFSIPASEHSISTSFGK